MKLIDTILLFLCTFFVSFSQEKLNVDSIKNMYKHSDIIFTAVVIYENIIGTTIGEKKAIDFDVTEIQKGRDYSRLMIHTTDTMIFEQGKEYLVIAKLDKVNKNQFNLVHAERVCKSCTNYTIKKIYEMVDKTPFATIKKPKKKTPWNERGCRCH